jgi:hypothetical protein
LATTVAPCLLLLLLLPVADDGYIYPPERRGDMVASLTVAAPEGAGPPHVYYTLSVEGGSRLEVDAPQLADPAGAWTAHRSSAWALAGDRVSWTEVVELEQVKPGLVPLPDVKLRFRDGPSAEWELAEWQGILKDLRELPGPAPPPVVVSEPGLPRWIPAVAGTLVILLIGLAAIRWRRRAEPPLSPDRRALRELDRLREAAIKSGHKSEWLYTQLSDVVRRYLTERFGLPAFQRTTAEFLRAVAEAPPLAGESDFLRDFLGRCDVAKFAGVADDGGDWGRAVEQAREFIQRTAAEKPA